MDYFKTLISAQQLQSYDPISNENLVIIDCRFNLIDVTAGQLAYQQAHIPTAYYFDLDNDLSSPKTAKTGRHPLPDPAQLSEKLAHCGINTETQVVVYDDMGGGISARLWWLLRWLGHDKVAVLDGGWTVWEALSLPTTATVPEKRNGDFIPQIQNHLHVEVDTVEDYQEQGFSLIDARAADRFQGQNETIDPIAGHISGAINKPFTENMDQHSLFLSDEVLRQRFAAYAENPQQVIHMCGSGVTACHNILAMESIGLTGSKLYSGSWSEWITNPQHECCTTT